MTGSGSASARTVTGIAAVGQPALATRKPNRSSRTRVFSVGVASGPTDEAPRGTLVAEAVALAGSEAVGPAHEPLATMAAAAAARRIPRMRGRIHSPSMDLASLPDRVRKKLHLAYRSARLRLGDLPQYATLPLLGALCR